MTSGVQGGLTSLRAGCSPSRARQTWSLDGAGFGRCATPETDFSLTRSAGLHRPDAGDTTGIEPVRREPTAGMVDKNSSLPQYNEYYYGPRPETRQILTADGSHISFGPSRPRTQLSSVLVPWRGS